MDKQAMQMRILRAREADQSIDITRSVDRLDVIGTEAAGWLELRRETIRAMSELAQTRGLIFPSRSWAASGGMARN